MTTKRPRNAIVLARISDARGDGRSVADQVSDARSFAERLKWGIGPEGTHVLREPDTSAFKRRKVNVPGKAQPEWRVIRPEFRRALDMLASGQADGLIAYDLDRACRDPRDLEDLIDLVEKVRPGTPVESVTGSLKLGSDADVTMARVMVAMGNKSSRDTGRRVARAAKTRAENGGHHGGRRAFGYDSDGVTKREAEAAEVKRVAAELLDGRSLAAVTRDLTARGVRTVTGCPWSTNAVREVLLRPRNAGIAVHKGKPVGRGQWEPLLDEDTWREVVALLTDPARRTTPGNRPRWLGSGIYRCAVCAESGETSGMRATLAGGNRRPSYRCHPGHVQADARALDRHVIGELLDRLSDPAALRMMNTTPQDSERADEHELAQALGKDERRLRELRAALRDPDAEDVDDLREAMTALRERIADRQTRLASVTARPDPLRDFRDGRDAAEVWAGLDLEAQREILRMLAVVTVHKGKQGRLPKSLRLDDGTYRIPPERVDVDWR